MKMARFISEKWKEEYILLEQLSNNSFKIKHTVCQIEAKYQRSYFHEDIPCRHCRKNDIELILSKMRRHFVSKLCDYELIDEKSVIHKICGGKIELPSNWKAKNNQNLCQKCFKEEKRLRSEQEYMKKVVEITNGEYEIIGKFENYTKPVMVRHNLKECRHEYPVTMNDFLIKNTRCPVCAGKTVTEEIFLSRMSEKRSDYKVLTKFTKLCDDITVLHEICNKSETKKARLYLSSNNPCSYCNNRIRDFELMREKIQTITNGEYDLLTFEKTSVDALFIHLSCGTKYTIMPSRFINSKYRCPECSVKGRPRVNKETIIVGERCSNE